MTSDYKYEAQVEAEQLAEERFGVDYEDLPEATQFALYEEGLEHWVERRMAAADAARDRMGEGDGRKGTSQAR